MTKKTQIVILLLRLFIGVLFLWSGISKLIGGFSAERYLLNSTSGLFSDVFSSLAGNTLIDSLVVTGEIGIGLSMLFGIVVRFGSFSGILMMILYFLSSFPSDHGPVDLHVVYALVFVLFVVADAGTYFGIDKYLKQLSWVKRYRLLRYLWG